MRTYIMSEINVLNKFHALTDVPKFDDIIFMESLEVWKECVTPATNTTVLSDSYDTP